MIDLILTKIVEATAVLIGFILIIFIWAVALGILYSLFRIVRQVVWGV